MSMASYFYVGAVVTMSLTFHASVTADEAPAAAETQLSISNDATGSFLQPSYKKWSALQHGMSEQEVISIIGQPLKNSDMLESNRRAQRQAVKTVAREMGDSVVLWLALI